MTPIIMLTGRAGSGKDTVAEMLTRFGGGVSIAQADPLKRIARDVFGFTEEQLWGPSGFRNAEDGRSYDFKYWEHLDRYFDFANAPESQVLTRWFWETGLATSVESEAVAIRRTLAWYQGIRGKPMSPRTILQTLGTEVGRALKPLVWVDYAQDAAMQILRTGKGYDRTRGLMETDTPPQFVVITDGRFRNEVLATKASGGITIKVVDPQAQVLTGAAASHSSETEQDGIPLTWYDIILHNNKLRGLEHLEQTVRYRLLPMIMPWPKNIYGPVDLSFDQF